ncbi:glycoside hydrolase family 3 protein [Adhaeribacter radiodurans]|uniref:beta-N-acetylhexosaminidase n=1 Tax=Adhaeribacter radiodurans TaxID=2745197 RepID=A0A7L7LE45_9BACT|nr:glycoside hydrolase family 3 protein [Adhaeribacter radiodurans]QMU31108.1 glycoside hydrolase family 3 [Adhaeribacter radiodurans]
MYFSKNYSSVYQHFYLLLFGSFFLAISLLSSCQEKEKPARKVVFKAEEVEPEDTITYPNALITSLHRKNRWVDSVFRRLTPDERIAQLMIVEAFSNKGKEHEEDVLHLIRKYKVGGLIFFQGGPVRQAKLTNKFQAASKVPLLISMDAESGIGMRMDSAIQYPLPMLLGAINNDSLIYRMGAEIALEFKRLGMHLNFAPVVDINNNPANPIIGYRAFGENKIDVASKSLAYMLGMQSEGIIATAKHFPGHGDTNIDSHHDLPVIPYGRERLDSLELYPFRELIKAGVGGIMVAHMHLPKLDSTTNLPSTLSQPIVTNLLKQELKFGGLVVTDAMVMKGLTKYFKSGEAEVRALQAGNDVLERLVSVPKAIAAIKLAIRQKRLSQRDIDRRCKKVLAAKYWVGLNKYKPIVLDSLYANLTASRSYETNRRLAEGSQTLLHNKRHIIPLKRKKNVKYAVLAVGASRPTFFQKKLGEYVPIESFVLPRRSDKKARLLLRRRLKKYKQVVIGLYGPSIRPSNTLLLGKDEIALVNELLDQKKCLVVLFDNAYTLTELKEIRKANGLVVSYQQLLPVQEAAAQLLAGRISANGKLPVTVNEYFKYGDGL